MLSDRQLELAHAIVDAQNLWREAERLLAEVREEGFADDELTLAVLIARIRIERASRRLAVLLEDEAERRA